MMRWMRWLVPVAWRDTVLRDIEDEARASNRSAWWAFGQVSGVALRLRILVNGAGLINDVRHALKSGWRSKAFATGAVLTFGLGVGVNVAVFSAVDRMTIRSLPYGDSGRLVVMGAYDSDGTGPYGTVQGAEVAAVHERHQGIAGMAVVGAAISHASSADGAQTLLLAQASYNVIDVLNVRMFLGRSFTRDDAIARRPSVLLTYDAWQSRFGARPDVVGTRVWSDGKPSEIAGVLPRGFFVPANYWVGRADGFVLDPDPFVVPYAPKQLETPPFVRLKPGVSIESAEQQVRAITAGVGEPLPATIGLRLVPIREAMFGRYATYTWLVIVAATLVLLMCCANLASLMFVRARSREHQVAVTMALGASRGRVIRQAVIESLVLASAGTMIALAVLTWTSAAVQNLLPEIFRRYAASTFEPRVLVFALAVTVSCALIAGIWPVARTTGADAAAVIQRGGGRHASGARRGGTVVLAAEAFIAALLVSGAGLTARSLIGLIRTDLGFTPAGLHTLQLQLPTPLPAPPERYRILMEAVQVLRQTPGLESAAAAEFLPFEGARSGRFLPGQRDSQSWRVTPGYFAAMGLPLLAGRELAAGDASPGATAAVISELGLSRVWPNVSPADALGRVLQLEGLPASTIVGVVRDVRASPEDAVEAALYLPLTAERFRRLMVVVRTQPDGAVPLRDIEARFSAAGLPIEVSALPVARRIADSLRDERFRAQLFGAFGVVALLLACVGLYAVTAFDARTRRAEMGVRLALGATPGSLRRLVLRRALMPVIAGGGAGLVAAWWAGTYMQSFLHQVEARDPGLLLVVGGTIVGAAAIAALLPARRASRVDPVTVLRAD